MNERDLHPLFQQMGEVLSGVRGLRDNMDVRQAQSEQLHDLLRSDLAGLRRDHRDLEGKFDCMAFMSQHEIDVLRAKAVENAEIINFVLQTLEKLRCSVDQLTTMKTRMAGLLFACGIVGSCFLWMAEPVYRWLVDFALPHQH